MELCPWTTVPYARSMACCMLEPAGVRPNPHPYMLPMPAQTHAAATAVVGLGYIRSSSSSTHILGLHLNHPPANRQGRHGASRLRGLQQDVLNILYILPHSHLHGLRARLLLLVCLKSFRWSAWLN